MMLRKLIFLFYFFHWLDLETSLVKVLVNNVGQTHPNLGFSRELAGFVIFKRLKTNSREFGWVLR